MNLMILLITLVPYIFFIKQDLFFPYWDPYAIKVMSYNFGTSNFSPSTYDPLFFVNIRLFSEITGISYYSIIRWGSIVFNVLIFFSLYCFFKSIIPSENKTVFKKTILFFSLFIFFIEPFAFTRFSMTVRENLVFSLSLFVLSILPKILKKNDNPLRMPIFAGLVLSYFLASHMLVFLVFSGTLFFYILFKALDKELYIKIKSLVSFVSVFLLISTHFLIKQLPGVKSQLLMGNTYIENHGFTVSRDFISLDYFNEKVVIFSILGLFFFILKKRGGANKNLFLSFTLTILIGFFGAFIERFGIRQNRFAIYIYVLSSFGFYYFLCFVCNSLPKKFSKSIILLYFILFFASYYIPLLKIKGYRPITKSDILYTQNLIENKVLDLNQNIYCGQSACTALAYLFPDKIANIKNLELYSKEINLSKGSQVFLLSEDIKSFSVKGEVGDKIMNFVRNNSDKIILPQ